MGHADVPGKPKFDVYESGGLYADEKRMALTYAKTYDGGGDSCTLPLDYLREIRAQDAGHPAWVLALALYDEKLYDDDPSVSPNA